ncbi:Type IV secretory pathway protease TraF-like protein [Acidithiobacillus ferrooxidans ATCC 53993]|uniref:S26 family signal peptidase n=1 Tax=Acidithiobacillus ferrooxidans TaxID=920 RepID=UPI00017F6DC6|nr:S26 family signal peptidase [Acidithiobacillus ferrooxidans]ACH82532.1 Type IV secretory pathway protease TraF-like protein [Acidithiobacillus ferrooxidans ATCC 53993]MBU2808350.1 conjugal transfer protein TraF [Acidithiobacillus ferrooxidans F221]
MQRISAAIAKRLLWWGAWAIIGVLVLNAAVGLWMQYQHLVFNDSTCEPVGLYQLRGSPYPLHHGELVEVEIPGPAHHATVAEGLKYHWFPAGQPWIKEIAAVPGQTVRLTRSGVRVDGHTLPNSRVDRWTPGHHHRIVHYPFGTYHLKRGQVWLYAPGNYAFDSSYYGPVPESHILQRVVPWWTIPGSQFWLQKRD